MPDLYFIPNQFGPFDNFHTFVGLGFLDVHIEMTVDSGQNVISHLWAQDAGNINMPVRPGDVMSGSLCLETNGTAYYFFANETSKQTMNFSVNAGYPLPSPSTRASLAVTTPSRSIHWPTSGSSISTTSEPPQRQATRGWGPASSSRALSVLQ